MRSRRMLLFLFLLVATAMAAWFYLRDSGRAGAQLANLTLDSTNIDLQTELERIKKELQNHPDSHFWHHQAAVVYGALGDYENSESEIQKAIELQAKNPILYYTAATIYQHQNKHEKEREFVWKALELDGRNPFGHAWLGDIYAAEGKWRWAVLQYQLAVRFLEQVEGQEYVDNHANPYPLASLRTSLKQRLEKAQELAETVD